LAQATATIRFETPPGHQLQIDQGTRGSVAQSLHGWLPAQRARVPEGSAAAKALDYSLNRWAALTRYLEDAPAANR
jgi:hypothetical protein